MRNESDVACLEKDRKPGSRGIARGGADIPCAVNTTRGFGSNLRPSQAMKKKLTNDSSSCLQNGGVGSSKIRLDLQRCVSE